MSYKEETKMKSRVITEVTVEIDDLESWHVMVEDDTCYLNHKVEKQATHQITVPTNVITAAADAVLKQRLDEAKVASDG